MFLTYKILFLVIFIKKGDPDILGLLIINLV